VSFSKQALLCAVAHITLGDSAQTDGKGER